jgi:hypothetical protein
MATKIVDNRVNFASVHNPQGFNIEKFAVVENRDIEVIER